MTEEIKKMLWASADKLRANMGPAEYKHIVLSLIFLKYISDSFETSADYANIAGFCRSVTLSKIASHGHVLTPGRYVDAEAIEYDNEAFAEKMLKLTETLGEQMAKGAEFDQLIRQKLGGLGYEF